MVFRIIRYNFLHCFSLIFNLFLVVLYCYFSDFNGMIIAFSSVLRKINLINQIRKKNILKDIFSENYNAGLTPANSGDGFKKVTDEEINFFIFFHSLLGELNLFQRLMLDNKNYSFNLKIKTCISLFSLCFILPLNFLITKSPLVLSYLFFFV